MFQHHFNWFTLNLYKENEILLTVNMPNFTNTVNISQCRQHLLRKSPDSYENCIHVKSSLWRLLNYLGMSIFPSLCVPVMCLFICIWSCEVSSDHRWTLEPHVESHPNTRCELMDLQLSTCDPITLDRWRTPRLIRLFFSLPVLLVTWASVPAVTDFLCHTVCKYIISPSLLLCLPPHQVSGTLAIVCLLLIRVLFGHRFPHWGARGGDRAVPEWLDRWRGWRAPQWAGTETRGAGREDAASCSASSITRAHWESRRAARQTSLRPICLQMWQGTDKRDGETWARQHLSQSVCQTLDTESCSYASLPESLQWVQADIFLLLAAGQARRACTD